MALFLLAGYETTSTTLSYAFYILATLSEEQEKLINEIDEHFTNDFDVSWLNQIIKSSLLNRFYFILDTEFRQRSKASVFRYVHKRNT